MASLLERSWSVRRASCRSRVRCPVPSWTARHDDVRRGSRPSGDPGTGRSATHRSRATVRLDRGKDRTHSPVRATHQSRVGGGRRLHGCAAAGRGDQLDHRRKPEHGGQEPSCSPRLQKQPKPIGQGPHWDSNRPSSESPPRGALSSSPRLSRMAHGQQDLLSPLSVRCRRSRYFVALIGRVFATRLMLIPFPANAGER